ncbi:MAG: ABC transporter permease [Acidobacteria bacterium]|nr:ABC transporter permease [Acidobacteriota bacterium]
MKFGAAAATLTRPRDWSQYLPDLRLGLQNLLLHKLRSLLTMLGMIFGVAAVVSMLSIGAGAQQQVMAFIEQLGVRNLIVEAKESNNWYGVNTSYTKIAGLRIAVGRFFSAEEEDRATTVCVLGEGAKANMFGSEDALGKHIKINEQWFRVIGITGPQVSAQSDLSGVPAVDRNNLIYVPLMAAIFRLEDGNSGQKDEIDGIYLQLENGADIVQTADVVRGVLNASHREASDFSVIVPAELLAEQQRTQRIFDMVMVAIASISLLVGGIGIMNIMLASILERTREIGVRRAVGARQTDIIRQFLIEAILISFVGGLLGIGFGFGISKMIAWFAGWQTIVTITSILLAFLVSVSVGLVFGSYPAVKAARLDPVEAIRYE